MNGRVCFDLRMRQGSILCRANTNLHESTDQVNYNPSTVPPVIAGLDVYKESITVAVARCEGESRSVSVHDLGEIRNVPNPIEKITDFVKGVRRRIAFRLRSRVWRLWTSTPSSSIGLPLRSGRPVARSDLRIRPIFHWTERRIHAHVAIVFISLMCVRHLQLRLLTRELPMSERQIHDALIGVCASVMETVDGKRRFVYPRRLPQTTRTLYSVGQRHPTSMPRELT